MLVLTHETSLWSAEKNALLKAERGISFEDVVFHIMSGDVLDTFDHLNQERYRGQQIHNAFEKDKLERSGNAVTTQRRHQEYAAAMFKHKMRGSTSGFRQKTCVGYRSEPWQKVFLAKL